VDLDRKEKENDMSGIRLPKGTIVLALAALVWTTGLASAQNAHFIKASANIDSAGDLVCSFKEAGLGDTETTYTCHADAAVTCTCTTHSGKCPNAANKITGNSSVSQQGTFDPHNGTVSATLTAAAPACPVSAQPTCGGGQTLTLSAVTYTNIVLEDVTHIVFASGLPTQLQTTFFTCP
jgi:hypothetical protein